MLEYDRRNISEGIDVNKTNASKECDICHYWYFLDKRCKYEPCLWYGWQDLIQEAKTFNDIAIVSIKGSDTKVLFFVYFWYMSKDDAINIMKNSNLNEENRLL